MNLRQKLTLGFFAMTVLTFIVSGIAYWQTERLSRALYEIGVVRLPCIQALDVMFEAKTSLDASKRELMRPEVKGQVSQRILDEEMRRQEASWRRAENAWASYESLPRTIDEDAAWRKFVPRWKAWRESYEKVMHLLSEAHRTGDESLFAAAEKENEDHLYDPARESRELLAELIAINTRIVEAAKNDSIASLGDMTAVRLMILAGAIASLIGAIACGIVLSRIITKPITRMSSAFERISGGDLNTKVRVTGTDEIGAMAGAMNRMVDSLRESELRFRAIFENTFDAIGVSKGDSVVFTNPAFLKLFGYGKQEEVQGRSVDDFVAPVERELVRERMRMRIAGRPLSPKFEILALRKEGSTFTTEIQTSRFILNGEEHIIAVHRDVTEARRAEAQLADFARKLEVALHTSKLGVWRRHLKRHEPQWDDRMFDLFGLPHSAMPPTREELIEMVVPEDREAVWRAWSEGPQAGRIYSHRFRIIRTDGALRHIEVHGMVYEVDGAPSEWGIGVAGDITEIVEAAAVSSRLREQLLQSQKMEALGTLSAGIAHDFNNFLTGINGFIDLARSHLTQDHESAELLDQAKVAAGSAGMLIQRILTFSRQARSSQRVKVDLARIAVGTTALISSSLPYRISLALEVGDDLPPVMADAGQIQQVLLNLCTNGVHAIGDRSGEIRVGLSLREVGGAEGQPPPSGCKPGAYVRLTVADTGCGMDAATLKRIFEPFFTTKEPGKGTGLGLSIVRDIMAAHDGCLDVRSMPGHGTEFMLYFPVATAAVASA